MRLDYSYMGRYVQIAPQSLRSAFTSFDPTDPNSIHDGDRRFGLLLTALRASRLLKERDQPHIEGIAQAIDAAVNQYFHRELEYWILDNKAQNDDDQASWPPKFENMDCPNPLNTSINDALLECTGSINCEEYFAAERQFELFAVLSLLHIDEAIRRHREVGTSDEYVAKPAMDALEALCNAEWMLHYARLASKARRTESMSSEHVAMIQELTAERWHLRNELDQARAANVLEFRSSAGKSAVSARQDQRLKPGWQDHCRKVIAGGLKIGQLDDLLNINGYDPMVIRISRQSLRKWARETGFVFISGRRKQQDRDLSN